MKGRMNVDRTKCLHCGGCVGACPQNAIFLADVIITFGDNCNMCGRCEKLCPVGAISKGEKI